MNRSLTVDIGANVAGLQAALSQGLSSLRSFAGNATQTLSRTFSAQTFAGAARAVGNFGRQAQDAGQMLSIGLSAPLALLGKQSLETFGEMDSLRRGLATLEKDSGALTTRLGKLNEIAKLPGLGMKETIAGDIRLRTVMNSIYGVDKAAAMSERTMVGFGNAVALVGKGKSEFDRALYGVQQLANTPFPLGEDLNIIKDAIPQVTPLLNAAFGTSRSDDFKKLGISSKQVLETILTGLEKLPKASGGAMNAFENFGDNSKKALDSIGQTIFKALGVDKFLNTIGDAITKLAEKFAGLPATTQTLVSALGLIAIALPPLIAGIGFFTTSVLPALRAGMLATRLALTAMTGPVGLLVIAIAAAATLIIMHWDKIKKALVDSGVWTQLKNIVSAGLGVVTAVVGVFSNLFQGDWAAMWEHIKDIFKHAWNGIISLLGAGILAMGGLLAGAMSMVGLDKMAKAVSDHMDQVEKTIESRKFDIAAPKFDLFDGFNFGGGEVAKGKNNPAGDDKKKKAKKEDEYFFIDYARDRVAALQKEIENLKALGDPIPQSLYNSLKVFTDLVDDADRAAKNLKGVDLGENAKEINGPTKARVIKAAGPQLPGLTQFQTGLAEKFRDDRIATEKEMMLFRYNLAELPGFMNKLSSNYQDAGSNLFTATGEKIRQNVEALAEVMRQSKATLKDAALDSFGGLAEGLAASTINLEAGKNTLKETLKMIIDMLASQAITIGKAMVLLAIPLIAAGFGAMIGTKQLLSGLALIAAGGIAKGLAATAFADGGSVTGPTYSLIGEGRGTSRNNPEWVSPVDVGAKKIAQHLDNMGAMGRAGAADNWRSSSGMTPNSTRVQVDVGGELRLRQGDFVLGMERAQKSNRKFGNG